MTRRGIALGIALIACAGPLKAQQGGMDEYAVKAAFLYHFTRFVDWPDASFETPASPFRICVFGTDPFGSRLEALGARRVGTHPIAIERPRGIDALPRCQIAYFADDASGALFNRTTPAPRTLTVASDAAFIGRGGMFALVTGRGRVQLQANLAAIGATELTVSAKLLEVAKVRQAEGPRRE